MNIFTDINKKLKEKKGFTLIEMIIVIAIIAILIAIIAPSLTRFLQTANQTRAKAAAKTLYTSANAHIVDLAVAGMEIPFDDTYDGFKIKLGANNWGTFLADYFSSKEIAEMDDFECSVVVKDSTVVSTTWKFKNGLAATYPDL